MFREKCRETRARDTKLKPRRTKTRARHTELKPRRTKPNARATESRFAKNAVTHVPATRN
jgi:hypothetical protein